MSPDKVKDAELLRNLLVEKVMHARLKLTVGGGAREKGRQTMEDGFDT